MSVKIISYNVNGIRSAMNKGLLDWLKGANPDILCLQEIKAEPGQLNLADFEALGYTTYWHPAIKKGYSGVALFTRQKPKHVEVGCGLPDYDSEGRVLRADFEGYSVMSVYFPSGTSGDHRQEFKYKFLDDFYVYIEKLRLTVPNLVICGDVNICHREVDIHNPISNKNTTGFLPEERSWLGKFLESGFVDSFRHTCSEPHHYTWWSFRFNARKNNKGWRIDYQLVSEAMKDRILRASILPEAYHSDHCPTLLELDV